MKRNIFLLIAIVFISFTAIISCKKESNNNEVNNNSQSYNSIHFLKVNGFEIGQLHNQAMVAGIDTSQFDFSNDANFLNSVSTFVYNFFLTNEPGIADSTICNVYASFISPPILINEVGNLSTHWNELYSNGNIDATELQLLNDIKLLIVANLNNEKSNEQFQSEMAALATTNSETTSILAKSVFEITSA